jgi:cellulose synthase/poly-beta-1,6-N-acetylglucosamine synthase-like glycosyltransferase
MERGLEKNIEAVLKQDYPSYEVVVITDTAQEPAFSIAKSVFERNPKAKAELHVSKHIPSCSGKVAALLTALDSTNERADVYAFIDSDALVAPNWLAELVDPLADETIGATTGFRWYFPLTKDFWSHVQSAWNAAGTSLFFDDRYNFPWGGATAVRAQTLDKINIRKAWSNAVSDDMALNLALRQNGYRILFLPQCTVATYCQNTRSQFFEWAIRQSALTRVFNERLWKYALAAYGFFDLVFVLGVISVGLGVYLGLDWFIPAAMLLAPSVLGILRSSQRCATFERALPHLNGEFRKTSLLGAMVSFTMHWIMTYCIVKSARVRQIEWRGRKYTLKKLSTPASLRSSSQMLLLLR